MKRTYAPDPRPAKRIVDKDAGRGRLNTAWLCPGCGRMRFELYEVGLRFSRFHIVGIDLGGDDVEENILIVCGDGTRGCHGTWENHEPGWEEIAGRIRQSMTARQLAYVLDKKGRDFLDRYYPPLSADALSPHKEKDTSE